MITVLRPGSRTTVQDAGRPGYEHLGVPTAGAVDPDMLALANTLAGNPTDAPALEVTLHGPTLRFARDTLFAYAGPDVSLTLDHTTIPTHHTTLARAGQTLVVGALHTGVYGYIAFGGGLTTPPVLGSHSTCTLSGLGPATLAESMTLTAPPAVSAPAFRAAHRSRNGLHTRISLTPGPHAHLFGDEALTALITQTFTVATASRVGVRLSQSLPCVPATSLPSLGMVPGAVQVPPDGRPIILGRDHGTTGGYPVIAVITPDALAALMQRRPGETVAFQMLNAEGWAPPGHRVKVFDLDAITA